MSVSAEHMDDVGVQFSSNTSKLNIYTQNITPSLALKLLESNIKNNRKIDKKQVSAYARQMARGLWRCDNGEGLGFNPDGKLLNGQHRLHAVIEYGQPVEMLVFSGIPDEAMTSLDDGKRRTLADAMTINGKNLPNQTAINGALSCLITLYNCTETERHYSAVTGARRNSTSEIIQFFDKLPNFKEVAEEFFSKFKYTKLGRVLPLGYALAFYYLLNDLDEELMFSIFKSYETGIPMDDLREASPIYHACERARRARELKIRVMPWDHIQTFLWVYTKCQEKTRAKGLPKFEWNWSDSNPVIAHARKKLMAIEL
jgi:hypothetical protein